MRRRKERKSSGNCKGSHQETKMSGREKERAAKNYKIPRKQQNGTKYTSINNYFKCKNRLNAPIKIYNVAEWIKI